MIRRCVQALALMALLLLPGIPPAAAQPPPTAPWYPLEFQSPEQLTQEEARNLRIPLHVDNPYDSVLRANTPVQLHVDLALSAAEAGWPSLQTATGILLKSFTADFDSLRLVQYTETWQAPVAEIPFLAYPRWFEPDQTQRYKKENDNEFHGQRNPVVTLEWLLPGDVPARGRVYYYLYYDILQNDDKDAQALGKPVRDRLNGLYWIGRATRLYGFHPGETQGETIRILAAEDGTMVQILSYRGNVDPTPDEPGPNAPASSFTLNKGESRTYALGVNPTHFAVQATRPVIVAQWGSSGGSTTFVPSLDAGFEGQRFAIPAFARFLYVSLLPSSPSTAATLNFGGDGCTPDGRTINRGQYLQLTPIGPNARNQEPSVSLPNRICTLTSTANVLLQYVSYGVPAPPPVQVPSLAGAPVGDAFRLSTFNAGGIRIGSWTNASHARVRSLYPPPASVLACCGNLELPNPDSPFFIPGGTFVKSSDAIVFNGGACGRTCAADRQDTAPLGVEVLTDATVPVAERNDIRVITTSNPNLEVQDNAFGGLHGMDIIVQGPVALFGLYDATDIAITPLGPGASMSFALDESQVRDIPAASDVRQRITSSKPVVAVPANSLSANFLAGRPAFVVPTIHKAEFRGYLVDLVPPGNVDPAFFNGVPDQTLQIPFAVRNLGRWNGGEPLSDTIELTYTVTTATKWKGSISFADPEMALGDGNARQTQLSVSLPSDLEADSEITITVKGTSRGNPNMFATFKVVVTSRQVYGVDAWWGEVGSPSGPDVLTTSMKAGQVELLPVVLLNAGTGNDVFTARVSPLLGGWSAALLQDGRPVDRVGPIKGGEAVQLALRVQASETGEVSDVSALIDFQSEKGGAADRLVLRSGLNAGRSILLETEDPFLTVAPGSSATFRVDAVNIGQAAITLQFGTSGTLPAGWSLRIDGPGSPDAPPISVAAGQRQRILLNVSVPATAIAKQLVTFALRAEGTDDARGVRSSLGLGVVVGFRHDIRVGGVSAYTALPGENVTVALQLKNQGNGDEIVHVFPAVLPGPWQVKLPEPLRLNRTGTLTPLKIQFGVPAGFPSGNHTLGLRIESSDGFVVLHNVSVFVQLDERLGLVATETVLAQPGDEVQVNARLQNIGNAPDAYTLTLSAPAGWSLAPAKHETPLDSGSSRRLVFNLRIPPDAGAQRGNLTLQATNAQGTVTKTLDVPYVVETATLRLAEHFVTGNAKRVGDVIFVTAALTNPGRVPVRDASISLQQGDAVIDSVSFDSVGPNATVYAALRWLVEDTSQEARLVWGANTTSGFRVHATQPVLGPEDEAGRPAARSPAPDAITILLLAGLFLAAGLRRRGVP